MQQTLRLTWHTETSELGREGVKVGHQRLYLVSVHSNNWGS